MENISNNFKVEFTVRGKDALETSVRFFKRYEEGGELEEVKPFGKQTFYHLDSVLKNIILFKEPQLKVRCSSIKYNLTEIRVETLSGYVRVDEFQNFFPEKPSGEEIEGFKKLIKKIREVAIATKEDIEAYEKKEVIYL